MDRHFVENASGVHLMMMDHTLCGDADDAHLSEKDWQDGEWITTRKRTVTCPRCIAIVLQCRGVRVAEKQSLGRSVFCGHGVR